MARTTRGTYYVGRVVKLGEIDDARLLAAIVQPKAIVARGNAWTFIDAQRFEEYIFARLIKYSPDAEVKVVDPARRAEIRRDEPNLSIAASPFVYIPAYSGIAFLHVAQHVEPHIFASRFSQIIQATYDNFFLECRVEFISDLRTFAAKLSRLEKIVRLTANLYPPNPLFGPLWENLKTYMEQRGVDTLQHDEAAKADGALNTELTAHVEAAARQTDSEPYTPQEELPIGDAAILMAADGYGDGFVHGKEQGNSVVIRTSETIRNFALTRTPEPAELYAVASSLFEEIEKQRHMKH